MEKSDYSLTSLLPNLSKTYERLLYNQMYTYFSNFSPQYQCCFRKGHSAQHCLLAMTEKIKKPQDTKIECDVMTLGTDAFF